jgi:hypothetical protein
MDCRLPFADKELAALHHPGDEWKRHDRGPVLGAQLRPVCELLCQRLK